MDRDDVLRAIDEVTASVCGWCTVPLDDQAKSGLFCTAEHQMLWHARQVEPLTGYREPSDVPEHVDNQVELTSPETVPPRARSRCSCGRPAEVRNESMVACQPCAERLADRPVPAGFWVAWFAALWNPGAALVRPENPARYVRRNRAPRVPRVWTGDEPVLTVVTDLYRLESVDRDARTVVYRIQDLQPQRYAVLRPAPGVPPDWLGRFNGRWEAIDGDTQREELFGGRLVGRPTVRYEVRDDGMYAEVWELRPPSTGRERVVDSGPIRYDDLLEVHRRCTEDFR